MRVRREIAKQIEENRWARKKKKKKKQIKNQNQKAICEINCQHRNDWLIYIESLASITIIIIIIKIISLLSNKEVTEEDFLQSNLKYDFLIFKQYQNRFLGFRFLPLWSSLWWFLFYSKLKFTPTDWGIDSSEIFGGSGDSVELNQHWLLNFCYKKLNKPIRSIILKEWDI